ncbi:hypothetical protein, partial [Brevundimonas sp. NPDC055320]
MIHRRCRTETDQLREQVARLEAEIRVADRRAGDAQNDAARLRTETESATSRSWDAAGDAECLRDRLAAAQDREQDLNRRIWELECQINDLTEDDSPVAVARTRQTRAVTRALTSGEEVRAQVLATLHWQAFHPEPELLAPAWQGQWRLDGETRNTTRTEALLRWRYGLTETEATDLLEDLRTRYQQDQRD